MKNEKILKGEKLSDDQLEKVAGGSDVETMKDVQLLQALGVFDSTVNPAEAWYRDILNSIESVVPNLTVEHVGGDEYTNQYFLVNGDDWKEISRADALKMICDKAKPGFDYTKYL